MRKRRTAQAAQETAEAPEGASVADAARVIVNALGGPHGDVVAGRKLSADTIDTLKRLAKG